VLQLTLHLAFVLLVVQIVAGLAFLAHLRVVAAFAVCNCATRHTLVTRSIVTVCAQRARIRLVAGGAEFNVALHFARLVVGIQVVAFLTNRTHIDCGTFAAAIYVAMDRTFLRHRIQIVVCFASLAHVRSAAQRAIGIFVALCNTLVLRCIESVIRCTSRTHVRC
jgi:hypothetical protein